MHTDPVMSHHRRPIELALKGGAIVPLEEGSPGLDAQACRQWAYEDCGSLALAHSFLKAFGELARTSGLEVFSCTCGVKGPSQNGLGTTRDASYNLHVDLTVPPSHIHLAHDLLDRAKEACRAEERLPSRFNMSTYVRPSPPLRRGEGGEPMAREGVLNPFG